MTTRYKNITIEKRTDADNGYTILLPNGKCITFVIASDNTLEQELRKNQWFRKRLQYLDDHGTMEGY